MEIQKLQRYQAATPPIQQYSERSPTTTTAAPGSSASQERAVTIERPSILLSAEEQRFFLEQLPDMRYFLQEYFAFDSNGKLNPIDPGIGNLLDVRL